MVKNVPVLESATVVTVATAMFPVARRQRRRFLKRFGRGGTLDTALLAGITPVLFAFTAFPPAGAVILVLRGNADLDISVGDYVGVGGFWYCP